MGGVTRKVRWVEVGRAAWGLGLLLAPRRVLRATQWIELDTTSVVVARVLGARHTTQAALSGLAPTPEILAMGVWVDAVHAGTALLLAATDRARFRAGLTDAVVASLWAAAGHHDLTVGGPGLNAHRGRRDALARAVLGVVPGGRALLRSVDEARAGE